MRKALVRRITARILTVALACMLFADVPFVSTKAATFEDINRSDVFLKQSSGSNNCTLVAATMLVRRAAMLNNNADWASVSINMMTTAAWQTGVGLKHEFTCGGVYVNHQSFSGKTADLADLLAVHPEGIVLYKQKSDQNHAVLVTDYSNGVFYCSDPSPAAPAGRITADQATVRLEEANYIWYVSSPDLYLTDANGNVISHENAGAGNVLKATATPKPTATPKASAKPKATATPKTTAKPKVTAAPKTTAKPKTTKKPVQAPKKVSSLIVKNNKKKTLTTSWKGVSGANGYQILYGTEKTFAGCASISQSKKKCKLTKLTKGKVYYVKVRAYNLDGSSRIYGQCSAVKKVKVKK